MKPYLIGESNPYGGELEFALYPAPKGCTGWRLCHLVLGMDPDIYVEAFERRNLIDGKWSMPTARIAATHILMTTAGIPLVLLGAKVAAAFCMEFKPFTSVQQSLLINEPPRRIVILPHPSGLCRLWHAKGAFQRARDLVTDLLQERNAA